MRVITFDIETRTSSPMRGRLVTSEMELIVVGVHDSEDDSYICYTKDELAKLWPVMERADMLVGYNSDYFDIPLLNRYYPGDLTKIRSLDLMQEVYKALGRRLRLETLAQATLGKGKLGDGAMAGVWWDQGLYDKVKEYCLMDVRLTRELYDYAKKHGALKYRDLTQTREIKLDARHWEAPGDAPSLTHTLPL